MDIKVSKNYKLRWDGSWTVLVRNASIRAGETVCHLCGKELERLTPLHAKTAHEMTWEEFLEDRKTTNGEDAAADRWVPRFYYVTLEGAMSGLLDLSVGEQAASSLKELVTTVYGIRKELMKLGKRIDDRIKGSKPDEQVEPAAGEKKRKGRRKTVAG